MSTSNRHTNTGAVKWRVFYTQPRAEKQCHKRLQEAGIRSFLPTCTSYNTWSDRKKKIVQPLFSNYIFAEVGEAERLEVLRTRGIAHCVRFGSAFAELSNADIEQIRLTQADQDRLTLWTYGQPAPGETVTLMNGPMKGLTGEVLQQRGASYVVVRIEAIRQAIRVLVPSDWVIRSSDSPEPGRRNA